MTRPRVQVVTSSSTCLDPASAAGAGITIVPLHLVIDGKDHRDLYEVRTADVYRSLLDGAAITTSSASVGEFVEAYRQARGPILCLTEADAPSTMYRAAVMAAELAEHMQVVVLPTGTAAGGLRLLALAAARMAAAGAELDAITSRIELLDRRVEIFGVLDSLDFLVRGGRVPQVASWASSVLKVRPVIRLVGGKGSLVTVVRSTSAAFRALERLALAYARRHGAGPDGECIVGNVFHAQATVRAEELLASLRRRLRAADLDLCEFTPAMGAHIGPGVVGQALGLAPAEP